MNGKHKVWASGASWVGVVALAIAGISASWFVFLQGEQREEMEQKRLISQSASSIAIAMGERAEATMAKGEAALDDLMESWGDGEAKYLKMVDKVKASMGERQMQIAVIGRDGNMIHSSISGFPKKTTWLGDREHFQIHARGNDKNLFFVSRPVKGRVSGKWSIQLTKALWVKDEMKAVFVLSIPPESLMSNHGKSLLGTTGKLFFVRDTGEIMAAEGGAAPMDEIGKMDSRQRNLGNEETGFFSETGRDGVERIHAWHKVTNGLMAHAELGVQEATSKGAERRERDRLVLYSVTAIMLLWLAAVVMAAKARDKAIKQAEKANEAKSRFLATVSHEIRNPMGAIISIAELKAVDGDEDFRVIMDTGYRILNLLNDLLDMSKAEAGKLSVKQGVFKPSDAISKVERLFRSHYDSKGAKISISLDDASSKEMLGDEDRLIQILSNLVGNALKHTENGKVEISSSWNEGFLRIKVRDHGKGIPKEMNGKLFKEFEQAHGVTTGTGLGLSIVQSLCTAMGGEVKAWNEKTGGSIFEVSLRVEKVSERAHVEMKTTNVDKILVVDDDRVNRKVISSIVTKILGKEVEGIASAEEALTVISEYKGDVLIFSDLNMTGMSGLDLARTLKKGERSGEIHFILVSGDEVDTEEHGEVDGVIKKPVSIKQIELEMTKLGLLRK